MTDCSLNMPTGSATRSACGRNERQPVTHVNLACAPAAVPGRQSRTRVGSSRWLLLALIFSIAPHDVSKAQADLTHADSLRRPMTSEIPVTGQDAMVPRDSVRVQPAQIGEGINGFRLGLVCGTAVSTLGATYIYLRNTWWKDNTTTFHFDQGGDTQYALNLDKFAHFYCGLIAADLFRGSLRWANLSETSATWFGVGLGAFVQLAIEMKDAFSPTYGFSYRDVASGIGGSLFHAGQQYIPFLRNFDIKFSYWRRSDHYFTHLRPGGAWNDDYVNQTYWVSFKVNNVLPKSVEPYWPDWLAIAGGIGGDDTITGYYENRTHDYPSGQGNIELYLALDWDITKIFPSDSPFWETVKHYLNYLKFPAPAVRITPSAIWYGFYF